MAIASDHSAPDLLSVGKHCAFPDCHQLDFLPFICKDCGQAYCQEHRTSASHQCLATQREPDTLLCPLCALAIRPRPGDTPDEAFERHNRSGDCDPSNYARVHGKRRCPVPRCREKLTSVSSFECKACGQTVCLAHRQPEDHACPGRRPASRKAAEAAEGRLSSVLGRMLLFGSSSASAPDQRTRKVDQAVGRPKRIFEKQAHEEGVSSIPSVFQRLFGGSAQKTASLLPERCPSCSARFATVGELIAHAESRHASGWSSGQMTSDKEAEKCPICGARFADTALLISHVEHVHP